MRQKLISARFRHLNQTLYTTPSSQALSLVTSNPEMFTEYHEGFRRQVEVWPENPVDGYISTLISRGSAGNLSTKTKGQNIPGQFEDGEDVAMPLPRSSGYCTIADLGCGDAAIATALQAHNTKLRFKIHSFDLHSQSPLVTKADIANLPLAESSTDVAIFCLALMGTNWVDFIEEAYRILRWKGELWVAEIKSRFGRNGNQHSGQKVVEHSVGKRHKGDSKEMKKAKQTREQQFNDEIAAVEVDGQPSKSAETDVTAFVEVLRRRGFVLRGEAQSGNQNNGVELGNKMFVKMWFVKAGKPITGKAAATTKAHENVTWKPKAKGGLVDGEEQLKDEGSVLKPCVYKLR
jgi:ribosomal RNA-processing protein 8